jgi:hypothetical protein
MHALDPGDHAIPMIEQGSSPDLSAERHLRPRVNAEAAQLYV